MTAPAVRLIAAVRAGAVLTHRPGSRVAHLYSGSLTPSGRWVPRAGRAACHQHTRRLSVLPEPGVSLGLEQVLTDGRRMCRRCMAVIPAALGCTTARDLVDRQDLAKVYASLTPADVALAGRWAVTSSESHQVSRLALILFGPKPLTRRSQRTPAQVELIAMHAAIQDRRRHLVAKERTAEERDELAERRDAEQHDRDRIAAAAREEAYVTKLAGRAARGGYLTKTERERLRSA